MRVIELQQPGGPESLTMVDRPDPVVGPEQVGVRITAATVNPVDQFVRAGYLDARIAHLPRPLVLGWDLAGVVETAGPGFVVGQRVAGMVPWFYVGTGTYTERLAVDPSWIAPVPDELDDVRASAVPLNAQTAEQGVRLTGVTAGQTLLVTGATGAVGSFAVQRAVAAGVQVLALASSGDEAYVSTLGAKEVLARQSDADLIRTVRDLVPGGVDAVFDAAPVGPGLIAAVRDGGAFITVLEHVVPPAERGITTAQVQVSPDPAQLAELLTAAAVGQLEVRIAGTYPLEEAAAAHTRLDAGAVRGRLVLIP